MRDRMWKYFLLKQGQMRNDPVQPQMSKRKQLFELFINYYKFYKQAISDPYPQLAD